MRQLILLFITLIALAASATPVDSVLAAFDRKRDVASANAFFKTLRSEQFIDEDITYATGTARDTLSRDVWYWAAEYLYAGQQYPRAISYGERALPLYTGDDAGDCLNLLAVVNIRLGDWDKAAQYAKRCNATSLTGTPSSASPRWQCCADTTTHPTSHALSNAPSASPRANTQPRAHHDPPFIIKR